MVFFLRHVRFRTTYVSRRRTRLLRPIQPCPEPSTESRARRERHSRSPRFRARCTCALARVESLTMIFDLLRFFSPFLPRLYPSHGARRMRRAHDVKRTARAVRDEFETFFVFFFPPSVYYYCNAHVKISYRKPVCPIAFGSPRAGAL